MSENPTLNLPLGWCWSEASALIGEISAGKSFQCDERPPQDGETGVVKVSAVSWGSYDEMESKTCTRAELINPGLFVRPGDFLFSRANTIELVGACVIADKVTRNVMLSDKILRFSVRPGWDKWLLWSLRSSHGRAEIERLATGNQDSMRNIGQSRVHSIQIPIPQSGEHHRIVSAIESYFTRLDDAMATLSRVERNLKRYRASVLKSAVEGRLVPTEAALAKQEGRDYEPASVLLERILTERRRRWTESGKKGKYQEPAPPDTTGLPELPEGWCWATVEQLGVIASGQTPNGVTEMCSPEGDIPWFRVADMNAPGNETYMVYGKDFLTTLQAESVGLHVRPAGTIIFPKRGGAIATNKKRLLHGPSAYDLNTMGVVPEPESADYLWLWFLKLDLGGLSDGSNVPQINNGDIAPLAVPLPPAAEQARIIEGTGLLLSSAEKSAEQVSVNARRVARLRQAVLKWAFEGKLVEQDPRDEPADVLLARIAAERAAAPSPKTRGRRAKSV